MPEMKQDRSIGELFAELAKETGTLVRQEVALARVELTQTASTAGRNVAHLAIGGAIGFAAFLAVIAGIIILVAQVMPWWAAAIVVGVVVGIVAGVLVSKALAALKALNLMPRQTVETLKEDAQWAKQQIK